MRFPCGRKLPFSKGLSLPTAGMQQQCPQTSLGSHAHFSLAVELPGQLRGKPSAHSLPEASSVPSVGAGSSGGCRNSPGCSFRALEPRVTLLRTNSGAHYNSHLLTRKKWSWLFFFLASPSALPYLWNQPCLGLFLINSNGRVTLREKPSFMPQYSDT